MQRLRDVLTTVESDEDCISEIEDNTDNEIFSKHNTDTEEDDELNHDDSKKDDNPGEALDKVAVIRCLLSFRNFKRGERWRNEMCLIAETAYKIPSIPYRFHGDALEFRCPFYHSPSPSFPNRMELFVPPDLTTSEELRKVGR
ncbi:hypothetical protein NPIL_196991 [Nephila pilipes]|uniref:Uncharacterized protein n=1 Tax=Nephila pilipes TaxID=299642 RepID=A0A8X6U4J4_NEPPI|nr:hypothetical protein NPIL_196991 [Nephila pilipes]